MSYKKLNLLKWASRLIILSGLIQSLMITTHINMITNLYSTIIGFYMFAFVMMTIMNMMNGLNFSSEKSLVILASFYLVSILQTFCAYLFVRVSLVEVSLYADVALDALMTKSIGSMGISTLLTLISLIMLTRYYMKPADIIEQYL
jgi:hypothetical protein